jgi:oxepin-CoA hydrolase/3-oxo-5,6-dehydrosuberyl-CoA semialdehyde dehydrogenase
VLVNPSTEEAVAEVAGGGIDSAAAMAAGREAGQALREMTFAQRGEILRGLSRAIHSHRDELIGLAIENGGNTRGDAKFDIDGASGTLAWYADLGKSLGDVRMLADGDGVQLGRSPRFYGQHVLSPRAGVAVFVNAFNFPAWGIGEKAATALLAGMPVLAKPATATAVVAHRMVEVLLETRLLPENALQLLVGPIGDLFDHLGGQDVVAFTGSSDTGAKIRSNERLVRENVRVNVEADSLNSAVLGPDVEPGSETYELFLADVARDMTQKTGQKCTAIRRVFVPADREERVRDDLVDRLGNVKVGNPVDEAVTMGPVSTASQHRDVRAGIAKLAAEGRAVFGGDGSVGSPIGAPAGKGYFVSPVLLAAGEGARAVHEHEVFGPVATLLAYDGTAKTAVGLVRKGGGGLVSSAYTDDRRFLGDVVLGIAPYHGRIYVGSAKVAGQTPGPGTAMPQLLHGGPGRAGAGEELGGTRGMALYLQRTALEGDKALLDAVRG